VTCTVEGDPFFVPGSIARELLMVVREAVYNAVLHGHPLEIAISVRYEPKELILMVADNGIGFNTNEAPAEGHFGITGMRERMERLGGTLDLSSILGTGTRVELSLRRSIVLSDTGNRHRWAMRWNIIK
jgi:signal transduction histidine kinase